MCTAMQSLSRYRITKLCFVEVETVKLQSGIQKLLVLVDGNQSPHLKCLVHTIIRGDSLIPEISAASILAKTARDAEMQRLHQYFPAYGFDRHKGYATEMHLSALQMHGACKIHPTKPADRSAENRPPFAGS